jgi:hypothetical protein
MRVRKERSNDTYQPSHDAACGLVFSSLDHVWHFECAPDWALAWPGAILQMHWSQVDFDAKEAAPGGEAAPVPQGNLVAAAQ